MQTALTTFKTPREIAIGVIAVAIFIISPPAAAGIFKCEKDGKKTYQQTPCEGQDKSDDIEGEISSRTSAIQTPSSAMLDFMPGIKARCSAEWPTKASMQEYCIRQQREAIGEMSTLLKKNPKGTEQRTAIENCLLEWMDDNKDVNHRMAVHCAKREISSLRRIR